MYLFIYPFVHSKKKKKPQKLLSLYNKEGTLPDFGKNASTVQHKDGQELVQ